MGMSAKRLVALVMGMSAKRLIALAIALFSNMLMILCIHIAIVACIDREPNVLVT